MGEWSQKQYPLPEKSDTYKMKEFFKAKYVDKRFAEPVDDDDDSDSSDDKKKKKKKKDKEKKKVTKKRSKKKVASSSSDEEEKKEDSSDGETLEKKEPKKSGRRGLGAPPTSAGAKKSTFQKPDIAKAEPKPVQEVQ